MPASGPLARGALRRPRSRPYLLIWTLPVSLHRLVQATQNLGGITGRSTDEDRRRPDRDRARAARARAASGVPRPVLHGGGADLLRVAREPAAALRGPVRREGGGRQGARDRRPLHLAIDR